MVTASSPASILIVGSDGTGKMSIVDAGRDLVGPEWAPDGTTLAYVADNGNDSQLVISAADGSARRVVFTSPLISDLAWSPDGSTIAYVSQFRAWAIRVNGGSAWPLTPADVSVVAIDWGPSPH